MINTQLFINNIELDVSNNVTFPLTYSFADVKEPEKRKRNSSKTIKLQGTKKNSSFFDSAYDLALVDLGTNTGFSFDPNIRHPARVLRNGSEIFRGSAYLTKVVQTRGVNEFHIVLYSELVNLFQALGDRKVSELGWDAYDHVLSVANIQASWTPTIGQGYVYPYIDFGFASDPTWIKTNELFPYVFVVEIIEKCFAIIDVTVSSTWMDSALIQKLIFGYGGGELISIDSTAVTARRVHYTGDGIISYSLGVTDLLIPVSFEFNYNKREFFGDSAYIVSTLVNDTYTQLDESTGYCTIYNSGDYNLTVTGTFNMTHVYSPAVLGTFDITTTLQFQRNGAVVAEQPIITITDTTGSPTTVLTFNLSQDLNLDAGDVIEVFILVNTSGCLVGANGGASTLDIDIDLNNTMVYDLTSLSLGIIDGDTVSMSKSIPNMKASEFMKDIITMFNMYMTDPDQDDVVIFEPEDLFYLPTTDVDDYTEIIDRSAPIEIMAGANIKGKTYEFHWAEDLDYYKQLYFNLYGHHYGDYDYDVPSTFKEGVKPYHLRIAQSIPVQLEGTDIIIPRIYREDDSTLQRVPFKGKPRMFFYNGLQSVSTVWNLVNSDTGAATANTSVPQAHHLDDLTSPTFDLNFAPPQWIYYTGTAYTTDNLFYRHYSKFIRNLTGRDSKVMNAFFKINEANLYENFIRRFKRIDGVNYRVNVVKDFESTNSQTTKIELVKIVDANNPQKFTIGQPPIGGLPFLDGGGGDGSGVDGPPVTGDMSVRSSQTAYNVDTSGGKEITLTFDSSKIRVGKAFEITKSTKGKAVVLLAAGGATIQGEPSIKITGKDDSLTIYFDGTNFKIV